MQIPPRNPKGKTNWTVYITYGLLGAIALFALVGAAAAVVSLAFGWFSSVRIEQVGKSNAECLPSRFWGNECKIGIIRKTDTHNEYCTVENVRKGKSCRDPAINGHGECDGEGTCRGDCLFDCPFDDSSNCPDIDFKPNVFSFTECLWGGCTTFAFGGGPLGLCGSEKSMQTCYDMIADSNENTGSLSVSQLCDEGVVFSCVFTAKCHNVDDFDDISPPPPMMVRDSGAEPAAKKATFNHKEMMEKVRARMAN